MTKAALLATMILLAFCAEASAAKKEKEISCSPRVLYTGDTLIVKTNQPFSYLGVTPPGKKSPRTLLVAPVTSDVANHSVIAATEFGSKKRVALPVKTAEAWFADPSGGAMQPIFSKAGSYVIEVGNSLANADDKTPFKCIVKYVTY
jgi:hypothetical protein